MLCPCHHLHRCDAIGACQASDVANDEVLDMITLGKLPDQQTAQVLEGMH
jgi:hypothetical protein